MSTVLSQTVSTDSSSTGSSGSTSPFHSTLAGNATTGGTSAWFPVSHIACSSLTVLFSPGVRHLSRTLIWIYAQ